MALPNALPLGRDVPPAPLDPTEVAAAAAPFGASRMLPRDSYFSPEVLAWELTHLFGGWMCVGRGDQVAEPGSMSAVSLGDVGVLLVRGRDGELRGFENACRHRGHELLPCGGSATGKRAIVCPYHAWSYRLDGSLAGAPRFDSFENFDKATLGLNPVRVADWHGWIFVDRSGRSPEFADHIGDLEQVVAPYDASRLITVEVHEYEVAANWKTIVENYQECYHCPQIHPELCVVSVPDSGDNVELAGAWVGGAMDLRDGVQTMSLDGRSGGAEFPGLSEKQRRTVMYVAVLPNLLISLHPDYVMTHLLTPLDPGTTRIRCSWAFPPEVAGSAGFDPAYAVDFWDITNRQDWAACESVQRGMASPNYTAGPLAPAEDGVYHFTSLIARSYAGT